MEVAFHTGIDDRIHYACRLLRKACSRGARVLVQGHPQEMNLLDQALWTLEPQEFLPHLRWAPGLPERLSDRTPIWLVDEPDTPAPPRPAVLVHMGVHPVQDLVGWERVIELVSNDEEVRRAARVRWRDYESRGIRVVHHPIPAGEGGSS